MIVAPVRPSECVDTAVTFGTIEDINQMLKMGHRVITVPFLHPATLDDLVDAYRAAGWRVSWMVSITHATGQLTITIEFREA